MCLRGDALVGECREGGAGGPTGRSQLDFTQGHLPPASDRANLCGSSVCSIPCIRRQDQRQGLFELRITLPSISYIVARSWPDSIIGRNNELPWHLRTDLQRFRSYTMGHALIMGRKTHLSIGRPLPGRVNIVLTRNSELDGKNSFWHQDDTMLLWAENRESALFFADVTSIVRGRSDFFMIGGAEMYRVFNDLFNKIYLTEVLTGDTLARRPDDAIFDFPIDNRKWQTVKAIDVPIGPQDDFPSKFSILERKTKTVRYVEVKNYYTEVETKKRWVHEQLDLFMRTAAQNKPLNVPYQYELFQDEAPRG
jgi:dihydrofolate reductase